GAVWAALRAEPGGSATMIGAAADLNRAVAGKVLGQLEADGHARRELGVNDGGRGRAADRWFPIIPTPNPNPATADAAAPTGTADVPAPAPETPDAAPDATPTPDTDAPDADTPPAPEGEVPPSAAVAADPAPADEPTDDEGATGQGSAGIDDELDSIADADADADADELESEPVADDPAWARAHTELTELANLFGGVLTAKEEGNAVMALGCLEMAMTKVVSAHRSARAALTGTATPAHPASGARPGTGGGAGAGAGGSTRPGALREEIYAHLTEFPGKEFSPHDMAKALGGRSSGAVANALDRLVQLGDAVLTTERPRRFALAPTINHAPATAPTVAPANPADAIAGDGAAADTYGN
ncbi:hypothetical protein ACFWX0_59795, partial [Nonomuraea sp. NPDC059022]